MITKISTAIQRAVREYIFTKSVASFEAFHCSFTITARSIAGRSPKRANIVGYATVAPSPYI